MRKCVVESNSHVYLSLIVAMLLPFTGMPLSTSGASPSTPTQSANKGREIVERVLQPSVKIIAKGDERSYGSAIGTGVVFVVRKGKQNKCYVLTAGHVVETLRIVREKIDEREGKTRKVVEWRDAQIVQEIQMVVEGTTRKVGELRLDARVVKYSPPDEEGGEDLAVLEVYKNDFIPHGARMLPPNLSPYIGQEVYHVGSLYGDLAGSLDKGIIAAMGRIIHGRIFHQVSSTAAPGSSGGGVWVEVNGKFYYIGMLTRGVMSSSTINFFIPISRIRKWLLQNGFKELANTTE